MVPKAADQGDADAQWFLAWSYHDGVGSSQSYEEAKFWFKKAADQGDVEAQYELDRLVCHEK